MSVQSTKGGVGCSDVVIALQKMRFGRKVRPKILPANEGEQRVWIGSSPDRLNRR